MIKLERTYLILNAAVIILLPAAAYFTVFSKFPPGSEHISAFSVVFFALPALWALRWWLGLRRAVALFAVLGLFAIVIEAAAIITGFPYGHFGYSYLLGFKLFGLVPWTVAFAWPPLIIAAFAIAAYFTNQKVIRVAVTALIATLFDLVIDPGAVSLAFWQYHEGGFYYGVPISNFIGWLLTAAAGGTLLQSLLSKVRPLLPIPLQAAIPAVFIVYYWAWINVWSGNMVPSIIGMAIALLLGILITCCRFRFDDKIVLVDENGTPLETADKESGHNQNTRLHLAFSVFLFDSEGRLLLQRRALSKKTWPGVWSNSCCGHVRLNERPEKAAERRLRQELGIRGVRLLAILPDFRYRAEKDGIVENEICPVFVGRYDGKVRPNADEVEAIEWRDWAEVCDEVLGGTSTLSPWAQMEIRELLDVPEFRSFMIKP